MKRKLLFELSKEHPTLPVAEAEACLRGEQIDFTVLNSGNAFLEVETETSDPQIKRVVERISLSFFINEIIFFSPPSLENLLSVAFNTSIEMEGSFCVRCEDYQHHKIVSSVEIERELGGIYARFNSVDVRNPDTEIRVILTDDKWYVCKKIAKINRSMFEARKVQHRPFFSPISIHPRLARAMVNLSLVAEGETLLDPFCGTGGILLEAGLIGTVVVGSDIQQRMVDGCKKTLDAYNIKDYKLLRCDIGEILSEFNSVDAVVTDFPYGRAASTNKENVMSLYERAFKSIQGVLKKGGRAVVTLPSMDAVKQGEKFFDLKEVHPYRVHKSLTRYIAVYEK